MALPAQGATIKTQNTMKCKVHMMVFTNMIKEPSLMHYDDTVFFCFFFTAGIAFEIHSVIHFRTRSRPRAKLSPPEIGRILFCIYRVKLLKRARSERLQRGLPILSLNQ